MARVRGPISQQASFEADYAGPLSAKERSRTLQEMFDLTFKYEGMKTDVLYDIANPENTGKTYRLKALELCFFTGAGGVQENATEANWGTILDHWEPVGSGEGSGVTETTFADLYATAKPVDAAGDLFYITYSATDKNTGYVYQLKPLERCTWPNGTGGERAATADEYGMRFQHYQIQGGVVETKEPSGYKWKTTPVIEPQPVASGATLQQVNTTAGSVITPTAPDGTAVATDSFDVSFSAAGNHRYVLIYLVTGTLLLDKIEGTEKPKSELAIHPSLPSDGLMVGYIYVPDGAAKVDTGESYVKTTDVTDQKGTSSTKVLSQKGANDNYIAKTAVPSTGNYLKGGADGTFIATAYIPAGDIQFSQSANYADTTNNISISFRSSYLTWSSVLGTNKAFNVAELTDVTRTFPIRLSIDSKNAGDTLTGFLAANGTTTITVDGTSKSVTVEQIGFDFIGGKRNEIEVQLIGTDRYEIFIDPKA